MTKHALSIHKRKILNLHCKYNLNIKLLYKIKKSTRYFYNFHSPLYNPWMNVKINIRNPKTVAAHPVTPNTSLITQ